MEIIHANLSETWIYYVSIKPSISRRGNWERFRETNTLIKADILTQPRAQFIDNGRGHAGFAG